MMIINPNEYGSLLIDENEERAINETLKYEKIFRYANSKESKVDIFENMLSKKFNVKHCLGVVNGTAGLVTALVGAGVKEGDRVLVSSFTFLATALAVKILGAIPIPIDIDLENGFELTDLQEEVRKGCKAVVVVHLQGRSYDLNGIKSVLKGKDIVLIEDACQSFGAKYEQEYAGCIGDIGVYSFQQFKQITSGEGGAIVTNNSYYFERMRNYSDMGAVRDLFPNWNEESALIGQNYRMNNLSATILIEQMKKLDRMIQMQQNSREYILKECMLKDVVQSTDPKGDTGMNIVVLLENSFLYEKLNLLSKNFNVEVRKMWKGLYYDNELFKREKLTAVDLKNRECYKTRNIIERMATISIPPTLTKHDCDIIISFIREAVKQKILK